MPILRIMLLWGFFLVSPLLSAASSSIVVYASTEDYETTRENLEFAITGQGYVVNSVMHIGDMLARTGQDLGYEKIYLQAESFEFCSAELSYRMMLIDPGNITVCPYTVSVYVTSAEPEQVYVAYQKPVLSGEESEHPITESITAMLDAIAREAADF